MALYSHASSRSSLLAAPWLRCESGRHVDGHLALAMGLPAYRLDAGKTLRPAEEPYSTPTFLHPTGP